MTQVRERSEARTGDQAEKMAFTIKKIGVIGAGQMGNGIAHVCALAGIDVLLQRRRRPTASMPGSPPSTATWPGRSRAS